MQHDPGADRDRRLAFIVASTARSCLWTPADRPYRLVPPGRSTTTLSSSVYWYALRLTLLSSPTDRGYSAGGSPCNPASRGFLPRGHTQTRRGTTNHQTAEDSYAPCAYTAHCMMHPPHPRVNTPGMGRLPVQVPQVLFAYLLANFFTIFRYFIFRLGNSPLWHKILRSHIQLLFSCLWLAV